MNRRNKNILSDYDLNSQTNTVSMSQYDVKMGNANKYMNMGTLSKVLMVKR